MRHCSNCRKPVRSWKRFAQYIVCHHCYRELMAMVRETGSVDELAEELAIEVEVDRFISIHA